MLGTVGDCTLATSGRLVDVVQQGYNLVYWARPIPEKINTLFAWDFQIVFAQVNTTRIHFRLAGELSCLVYAGWSI